MTAGLKRERHVDQTPERRFELWTHPEQIAQWWGPKDDAGAPFKATVEAWSMTFGEKILAESVMLHEGIEPDIRGFDTNIRFIAIASVHDAMVNFA